MRAEKERMLPRVLSLLLLVLRLRPRREFPAALLERLKRKTHLKDPLRLMRGQMTIVHLFDPSLFEPMRKMLKIM